MQDNSYTKYTSQLNRAERRKLKIKDKPKTYNVRACDIESMKIEECKKATDLAFALMLAIPVMAIHDYYPELMKKEVNGKNREKRLIDRIMYIYEAYNDGYISLDDLSECLEREAGVKLQRLKGA